MICRSVFRPITFILFAFISACSLTNKSPQYFNTPDAALSGLEDVVSAASADKAQKLLGSEGDYLLHRGDPVADRERAKRFVELFKQKHELVKNENDTYTLYVGKKSWPFPVPLVSGEKGWFFDAESGREEILTTTIGSNELSALAVSRDVYLAQRKYASADWDQDGILKYADKIISSPGNKDGLYWPQEDGLDQSPLGPRIATAADENYTVNINGEPKPYKGYLFKLYTKAPSGKSTDKLEKPGSYWLVATPAEWGISGIMTFATNERGWIYEKNLTKNIELSEIKPNVDNGWSRIE